MSTDSTVFNGLVAEYVALRTEFRDYESTLSQHSYFRLRVIRKEIEKFQYFLTKFTLLYEQMLKEKLLGDTTGERSKYLEAIMATINKIQSIYLVNLTQKEGRRLTNWNFGVAILSILLGLACTVYSIWYSKEDNKPNQDEVSRMLTKHEKQIEKVLKQDSIILDLLTHKPVKKTVPKHTPVIQ